MEDNYCEYCDYTSSDISNFKKHIKTKKHKKQVEIYILNGSLSESETHKSLTCPYCEKNISHEKNRTRHYKSCKKKKEYEKDKIIQQKDKELLQEKLMVQQLLQEKSDLEMEYQRFLKQLALNNSQKNGLNNNNTINMVYVINNFTNPGDYEKIMAEPPTEAEIERLLMLGPEYGCSDLIISRCVKGIPIDERSLHCTDISRYKFSIFKGNRWTIDYKGDHIIDQTLKHLDDVYVNNFKGPIEKKIEYIDKLIAIKKKGPLRKKIMDTIVKSTMLANVDIRSIDINKLNRKKHKQVKI